MEDNERPEITPLDFLEAVYLNYLNPNLPLPTRMRAAIEAAPYKHPKQSAVAIAHYGPSFADALEKAIVRSKGLPVLNAPKTIEHEPVPELDRSVLKKPFPINRTYRRS